MFELHIAPVRRSCLECKDGDTLQRRKKKGADAAAPWWRELEINNSWKGTEGSRSRDCPLWARCGDLLRDLELSDESQKVRPLQTERTGGMSTVPAVGGECYDQELALELVDGPLVLIGRRLLHRLSPPRCRPIRGSPGHIRSRCRASSRGSAGTPRHERL